MQSKLFQHQALLQTILTSGARGTRKKLKLISVKVVVHTCIHGSITEYIYIHTGIPQHVNADHFLQDDRTRIAAETCLQKECGAILAG